MKFIPSKGFGRLIAAGVVAAMLTGGGVTAAVAAGATGATSVPLYCEFDPCYTPQHFRVAYGIQPLLGNGVDGRGETVTVLVPVPRPGDHWGTL